MASLFAPIKQGSIKTRVIDSIREAIYAGKLRPGESLLELQLAKDFRVSQTTVREALMQLERLGLVRRFPNRGTHVTELSPKEVRERLDVRVQLECFAAVQAAPNIDQPIADRLSDLADLIGSAIERKDYAGSAQADLEFHRIIWNCSGNETLAQMLLQVCAPMLAFVSILRSRREDNSGMILHSHREIIDALLNGDPARIRTTVENHFAGSYESFTHR
jgi:DNA-binding GntR family transcriptional regulator